MDGDFTTLVFDLDGTLTDPSLGITRCVNHALESQGYVPLPASAVAAEIGPPLDEMFRRLMPQLSDVEVPALVAAYRDRYAQAGYAENRLYPDIEQALGVLAEAGVRMGVCTSKRGDFAERILELFGLRARFAFVSGGDVGIPKSEQLRALVAAGTIDDGAVMIGDRAVDIQAAAANGLRSIGVLWGFGAPAELAAACPSRTVGSMAELLRAVGGHAAAGR